MRQTSYQHPYPRRRVLRFALHQLSKAVLGAMTRFRIIGQENLPKSGPLIVIPNHFHFADTAVMVRMAPWPMDFLGGFHLVDPPRGLIWIPKLWGYHEVHRGAVSRDAIRASVDIMAQNGVLTIFPEGGSWADVLRPARPGPAFLADKTGARLLPVGLDGVPDIFPRLSQGKRAEITVRIGKPFGPLKAAGRGKARREALDELGHEMMRRIAELIPPERRGVYSDDPAIREAAREAAIYPYDNLHETGLPARR